MENLEEYRENAEEDYITTPISVLRYISEAEIELKNTGRKLEYWKKRCGLAERYLEESPCDPDITKKQMEAYLKYKQFLTNNKQPSK